MKKYLIDSKARPSAVIADNCYTALGVYQACQELNIRIGEDLSLVNFDDPDYCSVTNPPMTTIRVNAKEMGRQAAERLVEIIDEPYKPHLHICVGTELIVRKSTFDAV
jgi:LacI family transcriptional regulator